MKQHLYAETPSSVETFRQISGKPKSVNCSEPLWLRYNTLFWKLYEAAVSPGIWTMKVFPRDSEVYAKWASSRVSVGATYASGDFSGSYSILCRRRLARKRQKGRAKAVACSWTSACWKDTAMDHRESEQFALDVRLDASCRPCISSSISRSKIRGLVQIQTRGCVAQLAFL